MAEALQPLAEAVLPAAGAGVAGLQWQRQLLHIQLATQLVAAAGSSTMAAAQVAGSSATIIADALGQAHIATVLTGEHWEAPCIHVHAPVPACVPGISRAAL